MESERNEYNLNTDEAKRSLIISLINNQQISMTLTNVDTNKKFISLITLSELKKSSKAFLSVKTVKDALNLIKTSIESGKIMIDNASKGESEEITFNILQGAKEYNLDINLNLETPKEETLPPKFDYKGNLEAEAKYGNTTHDTTEYSQPIIKNNVKEPIMEIEYIEPVLQVHYPDGTVKSQALPPRIQGVGGQFPKISAEQFRQIREQMNRNIEFQNFHRSNSAAKGHSHSSMYSTNTSSSYINNNNISQNNKFNNDIYTSMLNRQNNILGFYQVRRTWNTKLNENGDAIILSN